MACHVTSGSDDDVEPPSRLIGRDDFVSTFCIGLSLPRVGSRPPVPRTQTVAPARGSRSLCA